MRRIEGMGGAGSVAAAGLADGNDRQLVGVGQGDRNRIVGGHDGIFVGWQQKMR